MEEDLKNKQKWNLAYSAVILTLVLLIVFFYLFTNYFS